MMVIIHGENRSEYCNVKKKNKGKHFFSTREQLYMIMPEGMCRIKIDYFGDHKDDEAMIYAENEIYPYKAKGNVSYDMDSILEEIDLHKGMTGNSWFGKAKSYFSGGQGGDLAKYIKDPSAWGMVIAAVILAPIIIGMVF